MLAALAACGGGGPGANNQAAANAGPQQTAPTNTRRRQRHGRHRRGRSPPMSAACPPMSVNGAAFLADPRVRAAVEAAVADAEVRRWVLREDVTTNPIGCATAGSSPPDANCTIAGRTTGAS